MNGTPRVEYVEKRGGVDRTYKEVYGGCVGT